MEDVKLIAKKRPSGGSSDARRLRRTGLLPGVIYGGDKEPASIQLVAHEFEQLLHHHASEALIIDVDHEGEGNVSVLVKDVQHHPVTSELVHVDLLRISADRAIHVEIPIELVGDAAGVKLGGMLDHVMHTIAVECLPGDLVESFEIDVTDLGIGDSLSVSDLKLDAKFKLLVDLNSIVASVSGPRAAEEEEAEEEAAETAEAAAGTEPEVITKKKAEETE